MSGFIRQECGKKCLACGSEAHRQKGCPSVGAGSLKGQASSREGGATSPNKQSNMGKGGNQPGIDPGRAEESLTAFMRVVYAASNASASSSNPVRLTASPASPVPPLSSNHCASGIRDVDWTAARCRLIAPSGRTFRLRVKAGCSEIVESEDLVLISKLEQRRLDDLKVLEANVGESASRIKAAKVSMSKGWWEHL